MKKISVHALAVFIFFMMLGSASEAWCQTSSVVSGNIPQDESRLRQDEIQLQDNESAGDVHAISQDEAYLNAQQKILINDENSAQSFANLSKEYQSYVSQSNTPYTAYQNHSRNYGRSNNQYASNQYEGHDYGPSGYSGSEGSGAVSGERQNYVSSEGAGTKTSYDYGHMSHTSSHSGWNWNSHSMNHGWVAHAHMTSPHILGSSIGAGGARRK